MSPPLVRHGQEAAARGALSSPPLLQRLQLEWAEWREVRSRLTSSPGSAPATQAFPALSFRVLDFPGKRRPGGGPCCSQPRPLRPVWDGAGLRVFTPALGPGPRVLIWSWGSSRATSRSVHLPAPRPASTSGSLTPAPAFSEPFGVSAGVPGETRSSGRPRGAEQAATEAVPARAGGLGRPATRGHSAPPPLAGFGPGVRAPSPAPHKPHLLSPGGLRAGHGTRGPADGGDGRSAHTQDAPLAVRHGLGAGSSPTRRELCGLGQEMALWPAAAAPSAQL